MQLFFETIYLTVLHSLKKSKGIKSSLLFFPYVFAIFLFILVSNLIGLLPYGYTLTSHIVLTGFLATSVFLGANFIDFNLKGEKMFSKFFILKDSLILSLLLLPLELISFFFRPIALACRLFSNMVAGHALLKIVENFL
jgi:F-type H+-transporting ATPase subunit a